MTDHAEAAREQLRRASDAAGSDVRENVRSVDEGLAELVGGDDTRETPPRADRLAELTEKLDGLVAETDGETRDRLRAAREHVDALRRERERRE